MNRLRKKVLNLSRRKNRIKKSLTGSSERPRMSVSISNSHISVQIIDDVKQTTLVHASSIGNKAALGNMTEKAIIIGKEIAQKAKKAKISKVVLDRNGKLYHGRIKALADSAREGGLEL